MATTLFFGKESPLSNFYACSFEVDGATCTSSEQAFMARKAMEFGDEEVLRLIRDASSPAEAKKLGRRVRGFDEETWSRVRERHMFDVCLAKFSQVDACRAALVRTGDSRIAEASPFDRLWGIGLAASHPNATDPGKWRGANLLGKVLERVRARLMSGSE